MALAWSQIYLGRMDDLSGDRENALVDIMPHWQLRMRPSPRGSPPSEDLNRATNRRGGILHRDSKSVTDYEVA